MMKFYAKLQKVLHDTAEEQIEQSICDCFYDYLVCRAGITTKIITN